MADEYTKFDFRGIQNTLARKLVSVADDVRDLYTVFGLRPYVVSIVRTRWSSGERGKGVEVMQANPLAILPTPLIGDLTGVQLVNTAAGIDELGSVLLSEVSGRFTEDQLRGHDQYGNPVQADEQFYYEVEFPPPNPAAQHGERRRFTMSKVPFWNADQFQWMVYLERQRKDRRRDGGIPG